jgi:hypothetical protein
MGGLKAAHENINLAKHSTNPFIQILSTISKLVFKNGNREEYFFAMNSFLEKKIGRPLNILVMNIKTFK